MTVEIIRINVDFRPPTDDRYLIINFKTYKESTGERAIELARKIDSVATSYKTKVLIAPSNLDLLRIASIVENVEVIAQHVDPVPPGAHTGSYPIRMLAEHSIYGALINHSEKPVGFNHLAAAIEELRKYGMRSIVCTAHLLASRMAAVVADFVAFEDPELIGSGIGVSTAKPDLVKKHIDAIRHGIAIPLVGAGISKAEDVMKSLELGAQGVLVASAIVKAKDVENKLHEFLSILDDEQVSTDV